MDGFRIERDADTLARFLVARGMNAESRIGIEHDVSAEMTVALLAVRRTGAQPIEIDLTASEPDRREHARNSCVDLVLTRADALYDAPAVSAELLLTFLD
jgi:hypothetical protein